MLVEAEHDDQGTGRDPLMQVDAPRRDPMEDRPGPGMTVCRCSVKFGEFLLNVW